MGLSYLAAVLERNGFRAIVYNTDFLKGKPPIKVVKKITKGHIEYLHVLQNLEHAIWKEIQEVIRYLHPDIVGITVRTAEYGSALNVAKIVKDYDQDVPVVVGGPHPTLLPNANLQNQDIDIVVRGEGEYTFLDLVQTIENGHEIYGVPGISYKKNKKIAHNPNRPLVQDLDALPYPARHLLLGNQRCPPSTFGPLITSRGCPFNCIFCAANKIWGRKVRYRSARNVVDEIKQVHETFRTRMFRFDDDSFTINRKHVEEICDLLIKEKLDITWWCETRVDLLKNDLVKKMKKAGCTEVSIGVESGDPCTLKKIKKGITINQATNAAKILRENKVRFNAFFMIGFPWETEKEIFNTVSLMKKMDPDHAVYSIATPYPETELFDMIQAEGLIPTDINWSTFYHQSPEMFFSKNLTKEKMSEIIERTETAFEKHNVSKRRKQSLNVFYVLEKIVNEGYYKHPRILWSFLRDLIG